jgi:hypothetical protein
VLSPPLSCLVLFCQLLRTSEGKNVCPILNAQFALFLAPQFLVSDPVIFPLILNPGTCSALLYLYLGLP